MIARSFWHLAPGSYALCMAIKCLATSLCSMNNCWVKWSLTLKACTHVKLGGSYWSGGKSNSLSADHTPTHTSGTCVNPLEFLEHIWKTRDLWAKVQASSLGYSPLANWFLPSLQHHFQLASIFTLHSSLAKLHCLHWLDMPGLCPWCAFCLEYSNLPLQPRKLQLIPQINSKIKPFLIS